jgi:two-component system, NtrC family, response regulator AtoC
MSGATSLQCLPTDSGKTAPTPAAETSKAADAPIVEDIGGGLFFVGESKQMREIRRLVELIAQTSVPVLVLGETGAGKEVVVRLIHSLSLRTQKPLLKVNCAALPAELLESELFGYEAGAFTGANKPKSGKFEACHKGTILLDEIAEMPAAPQAKLLQVLQDGEFCRLGSHRSIRVDVRVMSATNVDIVTAIQAKRFREDLYYRLNAFTLHVPPLRERPEDIPILLSHFMKRLAVELGCEPLPISANLLRATLRYAWPGNVRELENFVKRYLIVRDEEKAIKPLLVGVRTVAASSASLSSCSFSMQATDLKSLVRGLKREAERQAIIAALQFANGNRKDAARRLNISARALLYKMREYNITDSGAGYLDVIAS